MAGNAQADWVPQTGVPVDEWQPQTARVPVREHTRARRKRTLAERAAAKEPIAPWERGLAMGVQAIPTAAATLGDIGGGALAGLGVAAAAPETGGTSLLAGPAAIGAGRTAGSAAGGYLGKIAENALAPMVGLGEPTNLLQGTGQEALSQGAGTLVGFPLSRGLSRLGGVISGKTAKYAAAKAEGAVRAASDLGLKFQPTQVLGNMHVLAAEAGTGSQVAMRQVRKMATDFLKANPGEINALRLHRIKQYFDDVAKPVFDQLEKSRMGHVPPPGPRMQLRARFAKNAADQARSLLRETVPTYQELERGVQGANNARKLLPRVTEGPISPKLSNLMGATEVAGRTLAGKEARKHYANLLSNPVFEFLVRRGVPAIGASPLGTGYEE